MKKLTSITAFICCLALAIGLSSFVNYKNTLCHTPENVYASFYYSGGKTYVYVSWTGPSQAQFCINGGTCFSGAPGSRLVSNSLLPTCTGYSIRVCGPCAGCVTVYASTPGKNGAACNNDPGEDPIPVDPG